MKKMRSLLMVSLRMILI
ncbi:hypothetical protein Goari_019133 [Gossypium aridum]|uniref:Uncharacterized protein n=1 Tax=Gossypium aridum TaxID=34290 RepID=A0A7J8WSV3_GOSAI|nr:hypothetical protein [Gossypium aridum]